MPVEHERDAEDWSEDLGVEGSYDDGGDTEQEQDENDPEVIRQRVREEERQRLEAEMAEHKARFAEAERRRIAEGLREQGIIYDGANIGFDPSTLAQRLGGRTQEPVDEDPEPEDQWSDEWRLWNRRQLEKAREVGAKAAQDAVAGQLETLTKELAALRGQLLSKEVETHFDRARDILGQRGDDVIVDDPLFRESFSNALTQMGFDRVSDPTEREKAIIIATNLARGFYEAEKGPIQQQQTRARDAGGRYMPGDLSRASLADTGSVRPRSARGGGSTFAPEILQEAEESGYPADRIAAWQQGPEALNEYHRQQRERAARKARGGS